MFEKVFAYSKKHAVELWKKKSVFYYPERSTCLFVVWPAIEHEQGTYSGHSVYCIKVVTDLETSIDFSGDQKHRLEASDLLMVLDRDFIKYSQA